MIRMLVVLALVAINARAAEVVEEKIQHAGVTFRVVRLEPERVRMVWKDPKDQPYRTFDKVQAALDKDGKKVRFIMNAGIFEPGGIPSGLYLESPHVRPSRPLNPADGEGNFFLKPNGVVWYANGRGANVTPSEKYLEKAEEAEKSSSRGIMFAVQSGPMLLIDGKRHPKFTEGSASKLHRNGTGVDDKGRVVFAITDQGQVVNFWDFAGLFLKLGCRNALFLDGDISQMAVNPEKAVESNQFGAMFVVTE